MGLGVRARMLVWLLLILLPVMVVGTFAVELIANRLDERVESELVSVRRLEAARLDEELEDYANDAVSLAADQHIVDFASGVHEARHGEDTRRIGGYDGFGLVDPNVERPLAELTEAVQAKASSTGTEIVELQIVGTDGRLRPP